MKIKQLCLSLTMLIAVTAQTLIPAAASFRTKDRDLTAIVDRHASAHGLPAAFARAVVKVESSWNPKLTGAAGEVGLKQIKHATAREMGFQGQRDELYEPDTNVRWGMKYLAGAWRLGGGDMCQAVLRYQAGHGAKTMTSAATAYCARVRRFMASAD